MYLIKNKLLENISPVFVLNFHSLKIVCAQALQHMVSHESLLKKHLGHRPKKFGNHLGPKCLFNSVALALAGPQP